MVVRVILGLVVGLLGAAGCSGGQTDGAGARGPSAGAGGAGAGAVAGAGAASGGTGGEAGDFGNGDGTLPPPPPAEVDAGECPIGMQCGPTTPDSEDCGNLTL